MTLVNSEGTRHPHSYFLDADHHLADRAKGIADQAFDIMIDKMVNQPRSLQRRIGPSEMGIECDRAILYKLERVPEPPRGPAWKPQVGTALHDQQERWFTEAAAAGASEENRWLCEQSVVVGKIAFEDHTGSTDLFDTWGHAVGDWKFVGPNRLSHYKKHGPSVQYRKQAHLYGFGWAAEGWQVDLVMIFFIPRDGELSDSYVWSEPYDEQVATDTMRRMNTLDGLRRAIGLEQALTLYPYCADRFCNWCAPHVRKEAAVAKAAPLRKFSPITSTK